MNFSALSLWHEMGTVARAAGLQPFNVTSLIDPADREPTFGQQPGRAPVARQTQRIKQRSQPGRQLSVNVTATPEHASTKIQSRLPKLEPSASQLAHEPAHRLALPHPRNFLRSAGGAPSRASRAETARK